MERDLLSLMKDEITTPKRLVNIKTVEGLHASSSTDQDVLHMGALTTLDENQRGFAGAAELSPCLAAAAGDAASPQIRNVATIGGNLCQRPRCWYFRNGHGLLAQKDGKSLVRQGDNRYHAILGNDGPAYFVSPSTVAPVLIAYNAKVRIVGATRSERSSCRRNSLSFPKTEQEREHDLKPDEMVIARDRARSPGSARRPL